MTADEILQRLGPTGSYQKRLIFIVLIFAFANAWAPLSVIFTHYEPNHHCKVNLTEEMKNKCNNTIPWVVDENGVEVRSSCLMYNFTKRGDEDNCPGFELNETVQCSEWIFETEDDGGGTVVSEVMGLVCDKDWVMPFIVSVMMVGRAIGLMVSGAISDR
ncbi:solute carrier family 22 member 4-like [Styela clava]